MQAAPSLCRCGARLPCATCAGACRIKDCARPLAMLGHLVMDRCAHHMTGGVRRDKWASQSAGVDRLPPLVIPGGCMGFRMPGSPMGVNRAYTVGRGRRQITLNSAARDWKRAVGMYAARAKPAGWSLEGQFELDVHSVFVSPLADRDGPLKLVQDALQGIVYLGDRQVVGGRTTKGVPDGAPRLECIIRRLP